MKNKDYGKVLKLIKQYNKIILIRHQNPDYDAYGSQFGLYYSLKENFKDKTILLDGDDNGNNFFNRQMDDLTDDDYKGALVILTDQSSLNMLCDERFRIADKLIILDHHNATPDFGDLVIIKPEYSSASELITEILYEGGLTIPKKAADAFVAISYKDLTDTSCSMSTAYKQDGKASTPTLEEAKTEFTVENGYFGYYGEYIKQ